MRTALAVVSVGWMFGFVGSHGHRLLPDAHRDPLTWFLTTGALSLGLLTLIGLGIMLVDPGGHVFAIAFAVSAAIAGAGVAAHVTGAREPHWNSPVAWPSDLLSKTLFGTVFVCGAAIIFNAASWPFGFGDALDLYAPFGKHLYETSMLPIGDRLYEAYPMLIPMAYAFTHWAAGSTNEYVARLVPAVMAIGTIGAAGALATSMRSAEAGALAAGLVVLTPVFGYWASTGYTDVPAAFYVAMTVLWSWHWWTSASRRALLLAGICAGLAMWTKNSTLTLVPSLVWLALTGPRVRAGESVAPRGSVLSNAALLLGAATLVAGPWYIRNLAVFGVVVPPTVWTDRARHSLSSLTLMLQPDQHFGVAGWILTAALLYGCAALIRSQRREQWHVLMMFVVPYLAAWWWLASYEARFLVTIVPLLAVMPALALSDVAAFVTTRWSAMTVRRSTMLSAAVVILAAAPALRKSVEYKEILLRTPLLDSGERHRVRLGGLYDMSVAVAQLPVATRLGGVPRALHYSIDDHHFSSVDFRRIDEPPEMLADRYDYVIYPPSVPTPWRSATSAVARSADGYALYATVRRRPPFAPIADAAAPPAAP